ncbi:hypothetical protein [Leptospira stimsonii]|uniref:Uncharacterized protein n=1 Tax=Leptospira stimsonii TaxID=2202203 RepID=A0ABY2N8V5_9LEPT|nr:hypothetical protein [Leptospira stimsonii]TGK10372.1 hypothetical protein EHO98_22950 [Leptospira stimsonii]TGM18744.1 hypothetical protein EHQ90_06650 [Leptospira stimsonii]
MRLIREITIEQFYAALEEGERRQAESQKQVGPREDNSPFSEEKYYLVASRRTGEICFASKVAPNELAPDLPVCYQVVRYEDFRRRWLTVEEFVQEFRRFKEKPEPPVIEGLGPECKKIAIEEDNVSSAILWSWFNRTRYRLERTFRESA